MSLDQDQASSSHLQITNDSAIHSFQPFESLPDEVLLLLLDQLSPFERCLVLSICEKWNQTILQRRSFFQYLTIPNRLSLSTALSVLTIFSLRSAFTLKHVLIHTKVEDTEDLDEIFTELKKSSASLNLLFLIQPLDFQVKIRRFSRKFLPNLNTLFCSSSGNSSRAEAKMWGRRIQVGINDKETNLRFCCVPNLRKLKKDEVGWLCDLKCLRTTSTTNVKDLHSVLGAAKSNLQQLDLNQWKPRLEKKPSDSHEEKIMLAKLTQLLLPIHEGSAMTLGSFILIPDGEQTLIAGYINCLQHFNFCSQRERYILLYHVSDDEGDSQAIKLETELFLQQNCSIVNLRLEERFKYPKVRSGGSFHLNFILELLSLPREVPGRSDKDCLLPELETLVIHNPFKLNKKLLKQFWETRKEKKINFEICVVRDGVIFPISRWRGEDWLNEEE